MKSLTLRKATLVLDGQETVADIKIIDGRIADVGSFKPEGEIVDLDGLLVLPGIIDAHVHAREPGFTHKEDLRSASLAALAGGVTSFLDMPNNAPPTTGPGELARKRELASRKCLVNYGFFLGATRDNVSALNHIDNVPGIKVYLGSTTGSLLIDSIAVFERILAETRHRVVVHAEHEGLLQFFATANASTRQHHLIRHSSAAALAVAQAVIIARRCNKHVHLAHVSSSAELELISCCKSPNITCEVSPHHLFLNSSYFIEHGNTGKVNPPLREPGNEDALWDAIHRGLIDIIASDHAPHTMEEKRRSYEDAPSGVPGLQTSLQLMLDAVARDKLSLPRLLELMCSRPAELFGMCRKGRIQPGYDADLCIVDPDATDTIRNESQLSKAGWTPFDGWYVKGRVVMTFVLGILKYRDGAIVSDIPGREIEFAPPNHV